MKRRTLAGFVMATFLLCSAPAGAAPTPCQLGPAPGAPGFAEAQAQREDEARTRGYLKVCDAFLHRFRIAFAPLASTMADLPFQPADLAGTPFAGLRSVGALTEKANLERSRLYRGFRLPDGHTLTLFEHDMSLDGASIWRAPEDEPERINGLPARLGVFVTDSGAALSHLSWVEGRRNYELWVDANVVGTPLRAQLFALAASLPLSVPGCPDEIPPAPLQLGEDGAPVFPPPPRTLPPETQAGGCPRH